MGHCIAASSLWRSFTTLENAAMIYQYVLVNGILTLAVLHEQLEGHAKPHVHGEPLTPQPRQVFSDSLSAMTSGYNVQQFETSASMHGVTE